MLIRGFWRRYVGNGAQQSRQIMLAQVAASQEQGECGSVLDYKEMNNWERQGVIHEAARICLMFLRI